MPDSMSRANTRPVIRRAVGTVKVPYPQPNSTTSPHEPVQSSFSTIHPGLKNASQEDSSGIPLSRTFDIVGPPIHGQFTCPADGNRISLTRLREPAVDKRIAAERL